MSVHWLEEHDETYCQQTSTEDETWKLWPDSPPVLLTNERQKESKHPTHQRKIVPWTPDEDSKLLFLHEAYLAEIACDLSVTW
jgi:hypothetical protein